MVDRLCEQDKRGTNVGDLLGAACDPLHLIGVPRHNLWVMLDFLANPMSASSAGTPGFTSGNPLKDLR